ncbi:hypothetical protein FORC54_2034 [Vibrio vulnificus]|nr:hypothetical protein FORC54_2034 [Vibrio vulnificus]
MKQPTLAAFFISIAHQLALFSLMTSADDTVDIYGISLSSLFHMPDLFCSHVLKNVRVGNV